jgi:hypothetical protein
LNCEAILPKKRRKGYKLAAHRKAPNAVSDLGRKTK